MHKCICGAIYFQPGHLLRHRIMHHTASNLGWEDVCVVLGIIRPEERAAVREIVLHRTRTQAHPSVPGVEPAADTGRLSAGMSTPGVGAAGSTVVGRQT
jgi:hypothetical protein